MGLLVATANADTLNIGGNITVSGANGGTMALGPCTATSTACNPAGTPFNLVNTSPVSSSASFTVMGDFVNSATSQVFGAQGVYSASFANQTLQQILAAFTQTGSVLVPSSDAQFTASIVPEPNTAYMLFGSGFALIGLRACFSKLRRKQV